MNLPRPLKCPLCGSEQLEILLSGMDDGVDKAGRPVAGEYEIATCKSCGAHSDHISGPDWDTMGTRYRCGVLTDDELRQKALLRSGGENDLV
jgi:hypothetical protein